MSNNKKRIGVYAGSFNPFHVGHLDILYQAQAVFDEVIIAVGKNPEKESNCRAPLPAKGDPKLRGSVISNYSGLLADFLNNLDYGREYHEVFLIRGLRNGDDLQYEQNQLQFIKEMYPSLRTVFFICDKNFEHISSSALRALRKVSEKDYLKYVLSSTPTSHFVSGMRVIGP